MPRVKRAVHAQKKRRKVLEEAKGYWGWKHSHYRYAKEEVEPELLAEASMLAHPPRVIAVYRRADLPRGVLPVTLALWHAGDPGNVGALFRSAAAFGAGIALSPGCADFTGSKALRASMG